MAPFCLFRHTSQVFQFLTILGRAVALVSSANIAGDAVCNTPACRQVASDILRDLHTDYENIDPCNDFYQLACGGFEEEHRNRAFFIQLDIMGTEILNTLHSILEQDHRNVASEDKNLFAKIRGNYEACMDMEKLEEVGLKPLQDVVERIKALSSDQEWQTQQKTLSGRTNHLTDMFLLLFQSGIKTFMDLEVMADDKGPSSQAVNVFPPLAFSQLPPTFYGNPRALSEYKQVIFKTLAHFRLGSEAIVDGIVKLEENIVGATPPYEDLFDVDKFYNKIELERVEDIVPELSITQIINQLAVEDIRVEYVLVRSPAYLRNLSEIIKSSTSSILQSFFVWKAVQGYADRIEHPLLLPLKQFQNKMRGLPDYSSIERWEKCTRDTEADSDWITSKFYVQKKLAPPAKNFAMQIVTDIQNEFANLPSKATWMSEEDQAVAQRKARATRLKVGYPTAHPNLLNPKSVEEYYSSLVITNATYAANRARAAVFNSKLSWSRLGKPTPREEFGQGATSLLAYYMPNLNELGIPAGWLQDPMVFHPSVPEYLSYGALGSTAGHELSHGFDPAGSHFDYDGALRDWWSNKTRSEFDRKAQCFVRQYDSYNVPHTRGKYKVDGALTLNGNVADAGGLHVAFAAWKKREEVEPSELLPRLEYFTREQLFFVASARTSCEKAEGETSYWRMKASAHAPAETRVKGSCANSVEFKNAFKCADREPVCKPCNVRHLSRLQFLATFNVPVAFLRAILLL